jgi:hypothetical protein
MQQPVCLILVQERFMSERESINLQEVELYHLPRQALVAFAARCARRVMAIAIRIPPVYTGVGSGHGNVTHSVAVAEEASSCGAGEPLPSLTRALRRASRAVAAARSLANTHLEPDDLPFTHLGRNGQPFRAAYLAAKAALDAVEAAAAKPDAVAALTYEAFLDADAAASFHDNGDCRVATRRAMRFDFDLLQRARREGRLTEETPVPPDFFGPVWPDGEPAGWPGPPYNYPDSPVVEDPSAQGTAPVETWVDGGDEIVIELDVPEDLTQDDILRGIASLVDAADDLHRAHGGNGLQVADITIEREAGCPAGVPQ